MQVTEKVVLLLLLISQCSCRLFNGLTKQGVCPPARFTTQVSDGAKWCNYDLDCAGNKKCCVHNRGKVCKPPAAVRPGICTQPVSVIKNCDDKCTSDSECAPNLKCCFLKCGLDCVAPAGVIPGFCPPAPPNIGICLLPCKQCPYGKKCCPKNCRDECVPTVPEKPGRCLLNSIFCVRASHQMCSGDNTCPGDEKCCSYMCGSSCLPVM
ncbi:whey acidic protein-like [Bombina bombina]|uniref:whey acidic protein-like n=1 Tax=Bombina bombina TaxID=8345 RepID=UPI00235B212F|nr:whey acidic protein-like [Bombina bombina]